MNRNWNIKNNILQYIDGKNLVIPSAEEIYKSLEWQNEILSQIPNLHFSKISSSAFINFTFDDNHLKCKLKVTRHSTELTLPWEYPLVNHCVCDGTWFFISNLTHDISTFLEKLGPSKDCIISIGQYLNLMKELRTNHTIPFRDEISEILFHKDFSMQLTPNNLKATLFPYQTDGFTWLNFMVSEQCGCILGDEMGLGKTLQVIALFSARKVLPEQHFLVIAPVTLLENWRREIIKFAPDLSVLIHQGAKRTGRFTVLQQYDVVIVSYGTMVTDLALINMIHWNIVALDEAQNIKNPSAARTRAAKNINRDVGVAVTGTPFENHMTDLWSLVDFIVPGFLGTLSEFNGIFDDNAQSAVSIETLLTPLMLRRRVSEVAQDLPERVDIPEPLVMSEIEARQYESERQKIMAETGIGNATLVALQKLRMYCTHPFLTEETVTISGDPASVSLKYHRTCEILDEIFSCREKAIIFTSYTKMFNVFEADIPSRFGVPVFTINGATPVSDRQKIVDTYSSYSGAALLVLNPKAAGTGLNITSAHYVIHYNLEWNPALEDQASARAYRRGQTETVFVYRLYYLDTVEEIVNGRIESKRDISELAIVGTDGKQDNRADIVAALHKTPGGYKDETL